MSDHDLLAIVLGHGTANAPAEQLARTLLADATGLHGLTRMTADEIRRTRGMGHAQTARVLAAIELGRRTVAHPMPDRPQFLSGPQTAQYLLPRFGAFPVERFGLLLLDTKHRLIRTHLLSIGALDASLAHPRDVFRVAVGCGASGLVLFHNHPSGDPAPSKEDVRLTERLVDAGAVVGVDVLDHLILADSRYYSFRDHGGSRQRPR